MAYPSGLRVKKIGGAAASTASHPTGYRIGRRQSAGVEMILQPSHGRGRSDVSRGVKAGKSHCEYIGRSYSITSSAADDQSVILSGDFDLAIRSATIFTFLYLGSEVTSVPIQSGSVTPTFERDRCYTVCNTHSSLLPFVVRYRPISNSNASDDGAFPAVIHN